MTKDRPLVVMRVLWVINFLSLPGTVLLLVLKVPHFGTPFNLQQTGLVGQPWKMQIPRYFWLSGQQSWFQQPKVNLLKEITGSDHTQPVDEHRDMVQGIQSPLDGAQTYTLQQSVPTISSLRNNQVLVEVILDVRLRTRVRYLFHLSTYNSQLQSEFQAVACRFSISQELQVDSMKKVVTLE